MHGGSRKDWQGGLSLAPTMIVKRFPYLPCFVRSRRIAQTAEIMLLNERVLSKRE